MHNFDTPEKNQGNFVIDILGLGIVDLIHAHRTKGCTSDFENSHALTAVPCQEVRNWRISFEH